MMHTLYVLPKDTCRADVTSNSENIKPVALAVIKLHLSEGRQEVFPLNFKKIKIL